MGMDRGVRELSSPNFSFDKSKQFDTSAFTIKTFPANPSDSIWQYLLQTLLTLNCFDRELLSGRDPAAGGLISTADTRPLQGSPC